MSKIKMGDRVRVIEDRKDRYNVVVAKTINIRKEVSYHILSEYSYGRYLSAVLKNDKQEYLYYLEIESSKYREKDLEKFKKHSVLKKKYV